MRHIITWWRHPRPEQKLILLAPVPPPPPAGSPANSDKCYGPADECNSDYFGWWCSASLLEDGTKR